jgi:hypothetical protein
MDEEESEDMEELAELELVELEELYDVEELLLVDELVAVDTMLVTLERVRSLGLGLKISSIATAGNTSTKSKNKMAYEFSHSDAAKASRRMACMKKANEQMAPTQKIWEKNGISSTISWSRLGLTRTFQLELPPFALPKITSL